MLLSGFGGMINRATCLNSVSGRFGSYFGSEVVTRMGCLLSFFFFFFTSSQSVPLTCVNFEFIYKAFH